MFCHLDVDAFFASTLQRRRPELRGKPLLALGMGGTAVIAASYEAKAKGVRTGMRLTDAKKLCPEAQCVASDFTEALTASQEIEAIVSNHCPFIEKYSIDEWFLDLRAIMGGVPSDLVCWSTKLREEVLSKTALSVSVGTAPTKLLAKMASDYRKPGGITNVVLRDAVLCQSEESERSEGVSKTNSTTPQDDIGIQQFLESLEVAAIPGIGGKRQMHAQTYKWQTAWDFAFAEGKLVKDLMGRPGLEMQQELLGESVWKLEEAGKLPKSISRCRSFKRTNNRDQVFGMLLNHLTYTVLKMRRLNLTCSFVQVWLRNHEYKMASKDRKLPQPLDNEEQILPYLKHCFDSTWNEYDKCTQVGLGLYGLKPKAAEQYSLFDDIKKIDEAEELQQAVDEIHSRHGRDLLTRGSAVEAKEGKKRKLYVLNE